MAHFSCVAKEPRVFLERIPRLPSSHCAIIRLPNAAIEIALIPEQGIPASKKRIETNLSSRFANGRLKLSRTDYRPRIPLPCRSSSHLLFGPPVQSQQSQGPPSLLCLVTLSVSLPAEGAKLTLRYFPESQEGISPVV
jgi:hypothetical protein